MRGPRDRDAGTGDVLDLPAVLALRRLGDGHRGSMPDLLGRGIVRTVKNCASTCRPACARAPHQDRRQGRAGPQRRTARRPVPRAHVTPSPVFMRKGENLEVEVPFTIAEALRGADVKVPTLMARRRCASAPEPARHGAATARRGPAENRQRLTAASAATSTTASRSTCRRTSAERKRRSRNSKTLGSATRARACSSRPRREGAREA